MDLFWDVFSIECLILIDFVHCHVSFFGSLWSWVLSMRFELDPVYVNSWWRSKDQDGSKDLIVLNLSRWVFIQLSSIKGFTCETFSALLFESPWCFFRWWKTWGHHQTEGTNDFVLQEWKVFQDGGSSSLASFDPRIENAIWRMWQKARGTSPTPFPRFRRRCGGGFFTSYFPQKNFTQLCWMALDYQLCWPVNFIGSCFVSSIGYVCWYVCWFLIFLIKWRKRSSWCRISPVTRKTLALMGSVIFLSWIVLSPTEWIPNRMAHIFPVMACTSPRMLHENCTICCCDVLSKNPWTQNISSDDFTLVGWVKYGILPRYIGIFS